MGLEDGEEKKKKKKKIGEGKGAPWAPRIIGKKKKKRTVGPRRSQQSLPTTRVTFE